LTRPTRGAPGGRRAEGKIALISLGCAKNLVDSEVMLGALLSANYPIKNSASEADIIIEAVTENMDVKKQVFREIDLLCAKEIIFASNTSGLSITEIASATQAVDDAVRAARAVVHGHVLERLGREAREEPLD
jgi:tRNA A37 methylthiotransferase MiaB